MTGVHNDYGAKAMTQEILKRECFKQLSPESPKS
jgi:hypothetical protein